MKKITLFILLISLVSSTLYSQRRNVDYKQEWDKQQLFWGFYIGLNKNDFKASYLTNNNDVFFVDVTPSVGFDVGLIGNLRITENISLRIEPGLSSNSKTLTFTHIDEEPQHNIREVSSTYLRLPLLLKLNTNRYNNVRPYVIGGASYDYNFSSNQDNPDDNEYGEFRMTKNNFMYEIGVGVDLYLPYFIFSPSIRGVFAINNELVKDSAPNSQWTGNLDYLGTRGVFIKFAFH